MPQMSCPPKKYACIPHIYVYNICIYIYMYSHHIKVYKHIVELRTPAMPVGVGGGKERGGFHLNLRT